MDEFDYARYDHVRPIRWTGDALELLDQRKLPFETEYLTCTTSDEVAAAIHALAVRGAPAIGIAAAWGVVLAERAIDATDAGDAAAKLEPALQRLNAAAMPMAGAPRTASAWIAAATSSLVRQVRYSDSNGSLRWSSSSSALPVQRIGRMRS